MYYFSGSATTQQPIFFCISGNFYFLSHDEIHFAKWRLHFISSNCRTLQHRLCLHPLHRPDAIFTLTESGETEIALARRAETDTGRPDNLKVIEKMIEELP